VALIDIVRSGVKLADNLTKSLQATVQFQRHLGDDGFGTDTYATAVPLKAIVDWKQKHLRTQTGELSVSRASIMFIDLAALNATTGGQGVSDQDKITLPDGTTGPILDMSGFIDAGTGHPVATEVFIG